MLTSPQRRIIETKLGRRHIIKTLTTTVDPLKHNVSGPSGFHDDDEFGGSVELGWILRLSDGSNAYIRYYMTSPISLEMSHMVWVDNLGNKHRFLKGAGENSLGRALFGPHRGDNWSFTPRKRPKGEFTHQDFIEFQKAVS